MSTQAPTIAVFKFASCDGCQLSLLDLEDELLLLAENVTIAHFAEASRRMLPGPYDITLVEGSVTTEHDRQRILEIRMMSKVLITIGACATAGGVQALRNYANVDDFIQLVYAKPEYIDTLATSTPIAAHVKVDYELRGCPVSKEQLLEVLTALLHERRPNVPHNPVCLECKLQGHVCVMVAHQKPCLGPVTHSGCGGLCPGYHRGCYGCFGPASPINHASLSHILSHKGTTEEGLVRLYRTFNATAPAFREASDIAEQKRVAKPTSPNIERPPSGTPRPDP